MPASVCLRFSRTNYCLVSSFATASLVLCYGVFTFVWRLAESWSSLRTCNQAPDHEFNKFTSFIEFNKEL